VEAFFEKWKKIKQGLGNSVAQKKRTDGKVLYLKIFKLIFVNLLWAKAVKNFFFILIWGVFWGCPNSVRIWYAVRVLIELGKAERVAVVNSRKLKEVFQPEVVIVVDEQSKAFACGVERLQLNAIYIVVENIYQNFVGQI